MDLLTDAIGLLASDGEERKPAARARGIEKRSESPSDFISQEDSIPFGPIFPLPQFGEGADRLIGVSDFSLPPDFEKRFLWYQKRTEKHYERQGKPLPSKTLTSKDERNMAKAEKEGLSNGEGGLAIVGRGRSGGSGNKPPAYKHLRRNTFFRRSHVVLPPDEIQVCECRPSEGCALDHCLNAVTHWECTPGYCPCGEECQNQRFQRCQYADVKPCKTEGRGWGLYAQEDIKAGQFVVEYCGEIINDREAVKRSEDYRREGLRDHYMLILSGSEVIDATKKGSYGRFINHSCNPSCVTKKWNVLGEVRVGVFAHRDIPRGEELTYDYDFEWYGGEKVRCRCGAANCIGFLGAKSKRFKEDLVLWEDDDERYEIDNVPTYDSDDEPIGGRQHAYYSSDGEAFSGDSGGVFDTLRKGDSAARPLTQKVARKRSPEPGVENGRPALPLKKRKVGQRVGDTETQQLEGVSVLANSDAAIEIPTSQVVRSSFEVSASVDGIAIAGAGLAGRSTVVEGQSHDRMRPGSKPVRKRVKKEVTGLAARLRVVKEHKKVVRGSGITGGRLVVTKPSAKALLNGGRRGRLRKNLVVRDALIKKVSAVEWVPSEAARREILAKERALSEARADLERLEEELRPKMQACVESKGALNVADAKRWVSSECLVAKVAFERHFAYIMHGLGLTDLVSAASLK